MTACVTCTCVDVHGVLRTCMCSIVTCVAYVHVHTCNIVYTYTYCVLSIVMIVHFTLHALSLPPSPPPLPPFPPPLPPSPPSLQGVPVALASGELGVRLKIRQSEAHPGPQLEVEGVLASLHLLLSPHQLHVLTEMAVGISSGHGESVGGEGPATVARRWRDGGWE